ncbi:hypothetical protein WDZ17_02280 [Pseudokineococcus basanitobsidens]|uniref:Uncharacterized protein n=1 Tax=Pseudokineococcus basanitobsidens TaxID=1926649 RepID=A0ABU8RGB9_9ACTN
MTSEERLGSPVAPPRGQASRRRLAGRHDSTIAVLAVLMAVAAVALSVPLLLDDLSDALPSPAWLAVVVLFALCEALVVYLPSTRHSHTFSLREIPAVLGLAFLLPQQYLSAYVVGSLLTLVIWSRQRGLKLAFNVAMFALEASVGLIAYRWVLGTGEASEPQGWVAALVAVLLTDLISAAAVGAAISLAEGRLQASLVREIVTSTLPASLVNTCAALIIVILVELRPQALPLLALVVGLLLLAYRSYVRLGTGYARLQALYRFVGSTGGVSELDEALTTVLEEARDLLRAESAGLVVMEASGTQAVVYSLRRRAEQLSAVGGGGGGFLVGRRDHRVGGPAQERRP